MILVVDASVAIKWFFQSRDTETDCDLALNILEGVDRGQIQLYQPPHFVAEVASVLAREKPKEAEDDLFDLLNVEFHTAQEQEIYTAAIDLSIRYRHHLFDTLYHAVALHTAGASLITADEAYYRKVQGVGRILRLADYTEPKKLPK